MLFRGRISRFQQLLTVNDKSKNTAKIKSEAKRLGFLSCGISKAEFLEEQAPRLENWLNKDMHGEMAYFSSRFQKRYFVVAELFPFGTSTFGNV